MLVDAALLLAVGMTLCAVFFEPLVRMGHWARVIGATIALAYAAPLDARGGTLGKKLLGLRVAARAGERPGMRRALIRNLIRLSPWFLVNTWMPWPGFLRAFTSSLPFAFYLGSALAVAFCRSRRALHDRVAGTRVDLAGWESRELQEGPWRLISLYAVAVVIAAVAFGPALRPAKQEPLERVMQAVLALPSHPLVWVKDNTIYGPEYGPERRIRRLEVAATFDGPEDAAPQFLNQVAESVRKSSVDLSSYDLLLVTTLRIGDTGIGYVMRTRSESFPIAGGVASATPLRDFEHLAPDGPTTWSASGLSYETRSWFVENRERNGPRGLFYIVEWNCPSCDPKNVTEARAQELAAPVFRHVCETEAWQRFSLRSETDPIRATSIGVLIVDRSVGPVYPRYGIVKKTADVCGDKPSR